MRHSYVIFIPKNKSLLFPKFASLGSTYLICWFFFNEAIYTSRGKIPTAHVYEFATTIKHHNAITYSCTQEQISLQRTHYPNSMSSSSSPFGSINNRKPFITSNRKSPQTPIECYDYVRGPVRQIPDNAIELINNLYKEVDGKDYGLLVMKRECEKLSQDNKQKETDIKFLDGEIICFKQKIEDLQSTIRANEMAWNNDYHAMQTLVTELKAEGVRRYMEHLEFCCSLLLPTAPPYINHQQLYEDVPNNNQVA